MFECVSSGVRGLLAAALTAHAMVAFAAAGPAMLTASDGEIRVIRADVSVPAATGFRLQAGDILQLGQARGAQVEIADNYALALGGGADVMLDRIGTTGPEAIHLIVLSGWVKLQPMAGPASPGVVLDTPELRARIPSGSAIIAVESGRTRVFSEASTPRVAAMEGDGRAGKELELAREQLAVRSEHQPLEVHPRPDKDFVTAIPPEMRDPLFAQLASAQKKPAVVKTPPAPVSYEAAAPWLDTSPRLRRALVPRFRPRISDPAFRSALDGNLARHPEWKDILHPPPPPSVVGAGDNKTQTPRTQGE